VAAFLGCKLPGILGLGSSSDLNLNPSFFSAIEFSTLGSGVLPQQEIGCGAHSDVLPLSVLTQSLSGCRLPSYVDVFYNRMEVQPNPIDVGNIVSDEQRTLTVFNGYFTSTDLTTILKSSLEGVEVTGPALPATIGPLQEVTYTLDISVGVGPPSIDGSLLFDFETGVNDITVEVTGSRVIAMQYIFRAGMRESLSWKTQVITSNNGYEQRMSLKGSPIQVFSGTFSIPNDEGTTADSLMYGWRGNTFALPVASECRGLLSSTSTASPNIDVNTDYGDFRVGGLAIIYISSKIFELVNIVSFTTNQIVADINITRIYPAGTFVMPIRTARLQSSPTRRFTGYSQELTADFVVTENISLAVGAAPDQHLGLDVFVDQPLAVSDFGTDTYTFPVEVIEYDSGITDTFASWLKPKIQRQFGLDFITAEEAWNFRLWLHRRRGKLRPFWMPTFENNMTHLNSSTILSQLVIVDEGQDSLANERTDIAIRTTTGWVFRRIVSITPLGNDLEVTLSGDANIEPEDVLFISWMGRKRLTSDTLQLEWIGLGVAQATVPITEINN
jgi:hypothetical protein